MSAVITAPIGAAPKPAGFVRRLFRDKPLGAAGGVIFMLFLFCGLFADVLAPFGMNEISPVNRLKPPSWQFGSAPTTSAATCSRAACTAHSCR
jgi:peptide/nickel transport system permease protein